MQKESFFKEVNNQWERVDQGITRQITGFNDNLMMVKVKFDKGAIGYEHDHFHSQSTYVASGKFKISIDGQSKVLEAGDAFFVNPNLKHGAECLEAGILIDVFNPVRNEFLRDDY